MRSTVALAAALATLAGCYSGNAPPRTSPDPSSADGGTGPGIPCAIEVWLAGDCQACHGARLAQRAPMSLVTRADFMRPAPSDPSLTVAEASLMRMQSTDAPMPPPPQAASSQTAVRSLFDWISAGYPEASCAPPDSGTRAPDSGIRGDAGPRSDAGPRLDAGAPDAGRVADSGTVFDRPPACTSGTTWNNGNHGSAVMHPGRACITCHAAFGAPSFDVAGTVYAGGHDPDECNGSRGSGAQIVITDATGAQSTIPVNSSGNFYAVFPNGLATPYTAKVVNAGRERAMTAQQTSGDCNDCHSQQGNNSAPGRIALP